MGRSTIGVVGISCCRRVFAPSSGPKHAVSDTYVRAVDTVVGAIPALIPANGKAANIAGLIERLDGILLTGSRSNVEPSRYGGPPHPPQTPEDPERDEVTLPLIRAAIARGLPLLAVCRGFQEMNVALGGTLHQRLADLPGRIDHSPPILPYARLQEAKAHRVTLTPEGLLHRLAGSSEVLVNSLHEQGVDRLGSGLIVEAQAPDGTIEAVQVAGARGFVLGVQWHPEYDFETDPFSRAIFAAFGAAVAEHAEGLAEKATLALPAAESEPLRAA